MTTPSDPCRRPDLSAIEVVPRAVADEIVAEAAAAVLALERELGELEREDADATARMSEATELLIEQADVLIADAHAYRARVIDAARAEASRIISTIPAPANGTQADGESD